MQPFSEPQNTQPGNPSGPSPTNDLPSPQPQPGGLYPVPRQNRKKLWLLLAGIATVMIAVAGYVFLFYIPNLPENVWNSGLDRSGQALTSATSRVTSKDMVNTYTKSAFDGTFSYSSGSNSVSGTATAKVDSTGATADVTSSFSTDGAAEKKLEAQFIVNQPKDKLYPTLYLKFNGLANLGLGDMGSFLSAYDNKWISIDEEYFKDLGVTPADAGKADQQVTAQDVADAAKSAIDTTSEYVLTSNSSKAVFERQSFVGKEKTDGVDTYHYKVGINIDHARAYCQAVTTAYLKTNLAKKVIPDAAERDSQAKKAPDDCKSDITKEDVAKSTYDLWMDTKYKVIYKMRVTETAHPKNYTEIGQKYDGSDTLHFFSKGVTQEEEGVATNGATTSNFALTFDINTKTATVAVGMTGGEKPASGDSTDFKATMNSKPYQGTVDTSKPSGATPIQDILNSAFGASSDLSEL